MKLNCALALLVAVAVATSASAVPVINEFVANHTGTDTNEYIEIWGDANTDYSDYWIVEVEGDSPSTGLLDDATVNVDATDANGIWWTDFTNNLLENGTLTLLLVTNFTGSVGDDIDPGDIGTIGVTFWDDIVDCVGIYDGGADDLNYCNVVLDSTLPPEGFTVGGASRIPNGQDTDTVGDWRRNDFDGQGIPGFDGHVEGDEGESLNTPGRTNVIPEPATVALILLGAAPFLARRRK